MTIKPDLLKWVPDNDPAKITDPGTTKRAAGLLYKEKPAFQFLNWIFNKIDKWFLGLQGNYFDVVIGSATQVTNNEATHEIDDLDDTLAVAGSRVLILDGTHTLTGSLSLSNADLKIQSESPLAILDVATFTATFSGARDWLNLRLINSGAGDIVVSGAGAIFEGINVPIENVTTSNGAVARTSGTSSGLKYGNLLDDSGFSRIMPPGGIILWSGTIANIPGGWNLCDGTSGTPNLTDRFVIHADADAAGTHNVGDLLTGSGSTDGHQLTVAEMPAHTHTAESQAAPGYGQPAGTAKITAGTTGSTGGDGTHDHDITDYKPKSYALAYIMKL